MKLSDLLQGDDGKLSQAKLAAASGHFLFACAFLKMQVLGSPVFNENLWWVYGTFAVGHTIVNAGIGAVKGMKEHGDVAKVQIAQAGGDSDPTPAPAPTVTATVTAAS